MNNTGEIQPLVVSTSMDIMSLNCAVQLLRYDDPLICNNVKDNSVISKSTEVSNKTSEITRITRKSTYQDKLVIKDDQAGNVKKKKSIIKKPQLGKIEPEKSVNLPKVIKKTKSRVSSEKSVNNSTNSDISNISDIKSLNIHVDNEATISVQSPIKTPKNKTSKLNTSVKKKIPVNNTNKGIITYELEVSKNFVPLKTQKKKTSTKAMSSLKKLPVVSDINIEDKLNEVERTNDNKTLKSSKTKTMKSNTSNKKKSMANKVDKDIISLEPQITSDFMLSKTPKIKISESNIVNKKKSPVQDVNQDEIPNEIENCNNSMLLKSSKIKPSKFNLSHKKKPIMQNVDKIDTLSGLGSSDIVSARKRGRPSLKKGKIQTNEGVNILDHDNIQKSKNLKIVIEKQQNNQESECSQNLDENTMMLRSNKPPKKKWSDEWSGDKLHMLRPLNKDSMCDPVIDVNNYKITKKLTKTQKSNYKKVKTRSLEDLNTNENYLLLANNSNTCESTEDSTTNVSVTQSDNNILISDRISSIELINKNDDIIEPVINNITEAKNMETLSPPKITSDTTTSTEIYKSVLPNENDQPSQLNELESISNSSYLPVPMVSSDSTEISYGITILSEAISRQCRESSNKRKSLEKDINEIMSIPKKSNSSLQSQVPSAIVTPQRIYKNVSRKIPKYSSELGIESVETRLQTNIKQNISLLSKRFGIPIDHLEKTVIEDPLSVFHKKFSDAVSPSMLSVSPIIKDAEAKSRLNVSYVSGSLDVEYKLEPIRESIAYEKTNLKDLMEELTKTMPSWSLTIITSPKRYVISQMSINKHGVPIANKSIVLDRNFSASVYINQCLEFKYSRCYTTATQIINLIKELNSI